MIIFWQRRKAVSVSTHAQLIDQAVAELKLTTIGYTRYANTTYVDPSKTRWYKALALLEQAKTAP